MDRGVASFDGIQDRTGGMADLEFFWDPVCPWAWLTSRWVVNVTEERPMDVDWRFIALRIVNKDRDYETEFRPGYERGHTRGLELLRVAAAVRADLGREAGQELARGNYLALVRAGLTSSERIMIASDDAILACVDDSTERLAVVRKAAVAMQARSKARDAGTPYLPPYAA